MAQHSASTVLGLDAIGTVATLGASTRCLAGLESTPALREGSTGRPSPADTHTLSIPVAGRPGLPSPAEQGPNKGRALRAGPKIVDELRLQGFDTIGTEEMLDPWPLVPAGFDPALTNEAAGNGAEGPLGPLGADNESNDSELQELKAKLKLIAMHRDVSATKCGIFLQFLEGQQQKIMMSPGGSSRSSSCQAGTASKAGHRGGHRMPAAAKSPLRSPQVPSQAERAPVGPSKGTVPWESQSRHLQGPSPGSSAQGMSPGDIPSSRTSPAHGDFKSKRVSQAPRDITSRRSSPGPPHTHSSIAESPLQLPVHTKAHLVGCPRRKGSLDFDTTPCFQLGAPESALLEEPSRKAAFPRRRRASFDVGHGRFPEGSRDSFLGGHPSDTLASLEASLKQAGRGRALEAGSGAQAPAFPQGDDRGQSSGIRFDFQAEDFLRQQPMSSRVDPASVSQRAGDRPRWRVERRLMGKNHGQQQGGMHSGSTIQAPGDGLGLEDMGAPVSPSSSEDEGIGSNVSSPDNSGWVRRKACSQGPSPQHQNQHRHQHQQHHQLQHQRQHQNQSHLRVALHCGTRDAGSVQEQHGEHTAHSSGCTPVPARATGAAAKGPSTGEGHNPRRGSPQLAVGRGRGDVAGALSIAAARRLHTDSLASMDPKRVPMENAIGELPLSATDAHRVHGRDPTAPLMLGWDRLALDTEETKKGHGSSTRKKQSHASSSRQREGARLSQWQPQKGDDPCEVQQGVDSGSGLFLVDSDTAASSQLFYSTGMSWFSSGQHVPPLPCTSQSSQKVQCTSAGGLLGTDAC